ncbi:hypothetical protein [Paenibacillus mucilaginosus]|uniref:hypothetical protein n=1 Tax=Paenibacillus mucilaginosus TaxID=61624 RepID=UPI003D2357AB
MISRNSEGYPQHDRVNPFPLTSRLCANNASFPFWEWALLVGLTSDLNAIQSGFASRLKKVKICGVDLPIGHQRRRKMGFVLDMINLFFIEQVRGDDSNPIESQCIVEEIGILS